jgi:transposase-like protein
MNTNKKNWAPPFCPNPNCLFHNGLNAGWRYKRAGTFRRQQYPFRVRRFTCQHCGRSFSSQTFSTTYWQKRPDLERKLFTKATGCMANRQIARDLKVSPSTIDRQIARLARHCLLYHAQILELCQPFPEVVVDGFESFEFSQYYPIHHNVAAEKDTDFFIYFTDSPLRRKGRMTDYQLKRRQQLELLQGTPDPKAIEKDMAELLQIALRHNRSALVYSDAHPAYPRAIRKVDCQITQLITLSRAHRDTRNSLWCINLLDSLIRHSGANHKRETIAFSKRRQASAERLAIFLVWRNYMKGRREKQRGSPSPAMVKGLLDHRLEAEEILQGRIFRTRMELPPRWSDYYDRKVETRALEVNLRHELKYAY